MLRTIALGLGVGLGHEVRFDLGDRIEIWIRISTRIRVNSNRIDLVLGLGL